MKLRIKYDVGRWIMWRFTGRVLYPFVLFAQSKKDVSHTLFRHELEHVYQVRDMGWVWFHLKYTWLLIRYGYAKHPFELQATQAQRNPLTEAELALKEA